MCLFESWIEVWRTAFDGQIPTLDTSFFNDYSHSIWSFNARHWFPQLTLKAWLARLFIASRLQDSPKTIPFRVAKAWLACLLTARHIELCVCERVYLCVAVLFPGRQCLVNKNNSAAEERLPSRVVTTPKSETSDDKGNYKAPRRISGKGTPACQLFGVADSRQTSCECDFKRP